MLLSIVVLGACRPVINNYTTYVIEPTEADSTSVSDTGKPPSLGTVDPDDLEIDVYGMDGHSYWLNVSQEQLDQANQAWEASQVGWGSINSYDVGSTATDDLVVTDAVSGESASFGEVEFRIAGHSTGTVWTSDSIPNLALDTDEFQEDLEIGGIEYFRFNNGQLGTIFREAIALQIFKELNYPAPRTRFAWLTSNVWAEGVRTPYTLVEPYKRDWCEENAESVGGGCVNAWEGHGDITTQWIAELAGSCQFSSCQNEHLIELSDVLTATPPGSGFEEATSDFLDWNSIHELQCISWIVQTGDDYLHNINNLVLLEREDTKFMIVPYSTDLSGGRPGMQDVSFYGESTIAVGCQTDAPCWADTVATCEEVINDFQALDPAVNVVDSVYSRLSAQGMLREGDEESYEQIRSWYQARSVEGLLETELETFRAPFPDPCAPAEGAEPQHVPNYCN